MTKTIKPIATKIWRLNQTLLKNFKGLIELEIKQLQKDYPGSQVMVSYVGTDTEDPQELLELSGVWYKYELAVFTEADDDTT